MIRLRSSSLLKNLFLIILCAIIGVYFRLYPATFNLSRRRTIISQAIFQINLRKYLNKKIETSSPHLTLDQRNKTINTYLATFTQQKNQQIHEATQKLSKRIAHNILRLFLLGSDSYYYFALTENLVNSNSISDKIKNGEYFNSLMMAPMGMWRKIEAHPYIGYLLFTALEAMGRKTSLLICASIVPLLLYLFSIMLFIYTSSLFSKNMLSLFIGGVFFSLSPIYIQRSSFGWYDTDPYNIIFPLIAIISLTKATQQNRVSYAWIALLSIISAAYALFWQGWLLLPIIVFLSFIFVGVRTIKQNKKNATQLIKKLLLYLSILIVAAIIILTPKGLFSSMRDIIQILFGFLLLNKNIWPDIFLTVGELKSASLLKIIHVLGGFTFFLLSLFGISLIFKAKRNISKEQQIILLLFYCIFFLMAKNAERFIIFFLTPVSLCFTFGLDRILSFTKRKVAGNSKKQYFKLLTSFIFCILLLIPIVYGHANAKKQNPLFNDIWNRSLLKLNKLSPEKSIINSWWSPGHFIKAVAKRSVTFDGATMNIPQAYWMANMFLAENEKEALGILRMLNGSGNSAFEFLIENKIEPANAIQLIKQIIVQDRDNALKTLTPVLSPENAQHLILLTHLSAPPSYCFIYNEMIDNALGLYYVKEWNFSKAEKFQQQRQQEIQKGNIFWRGTKENINSIWSVSGGPTYIGKESFEVHRNKNIIYFGNGVELNTDTMYAKIHNLEGKLSGIPQSVFFTQNNTLIEKSLNNTSLRISVLIVKYPNNTYSSIIAAAPILKSVLFRLYFLNGIGLEHFQEVIREENPLLNMRILVYKINWNDFSNK